MKQFLLPPSFKGGNELLITGKDAHYLTNVLRKAPGETFSGIDTRGARYLLTINEIREGTVLLSAQLSQDNEAAALPEITLIQCLPKGKKMDMIIRQAAELGAARIVPVISEHSIPKFDEREKEKKRLRWEKVIKEAVQQSGNTVIPEIQSVVSLPELVRRDRFSWEMGLFFYEKPLETGSLHGYLSVHPKSVALLIGPEGGFSEKEVRIVMDAGFRPVYLGKRILRVETAAASALALVQLLLMEKKLWKMH